MQLLSIVCILNSRQIDNARAGMNDYPKPFLKRIRIEHPYVPYVIQWTKRIRDGFLFPSYGGSRTIRVKQKDDDGNVVKIYEYHKPGGHLSYMRVYQQIREINPNAWCHLFRESLATHMAENGATEEELMHWFDWDRYDTAHKYVKHGTKLTEKWSNRGF